MLNNNTIKCWNESFLVQPQQDSIQNIPDSIQGKVVSIECGTFHWIALLNDNSIKCWGNNKYGQCTPPEGLKVMRKN